MITKIKVNEVGSIVSNIDDDEINTDKATYHILKLLTKIEENTRK